MGRGDGLGSADGVLAHEGVGLVLVREGLRVGVGVRTLLGRGEVVVERGGFIAVSGVLAVVVLASTVHSCCSCWCWGEGLCCLPINTNNNNKKEGVNK